MQPRWYPLVPYGWLKKLWCTMAWLRASPIVLWESAWLTFSAAVKHAEEILVRKSASVLQSQQFSAALLRLVQIFSTDRSFRVCSFGPGLFSVWSKIKWHLWSTSRPQPKPRRLLQSYHFKVWFLLGVRIWLDFTLSHQKKSERLSCELSQEEIN